MGMTEGAGKHRDYVSFLLRMWQDGGDGGAPLKQRTLWRASLQSPHTGERIGFADLEKLFAYLRAQTYDGIREEENQGKEKNENGQQEHL